MVSRNQTTLQGGSNTELSPMRVVQVLRLDSVGEADDESVVSASERKQRSSLDSDRDDGGVSSRPSELEQFSIDVSGRSMAFEELEYGNELQELPLSHRTSSISEGLTSRSYHSSGGSSDDGSHDDMPRVSRRRVNRRRSMPSLSSIHENEHTLFVLYDVGASNHTSLAESFASDNYGDSESFVDASFRTTSTAASSDGNIALLQDPGNRLFPPKMQVAFRSNNAHLGGIPKEALSPPCARTLLEPKTPGKHILRWDAPIPEVGVNFVGDRPMQAPLRQQFNSDDSLGSISAGRSPIVGIPRWGHIGGPLLRGMPAGKSSSLHNIRVDSRPVLAVRLPSLTSVASSIEAMSLESLPSLA